MPIIELVNYTLAQSEPDCGMHHVNFALAEGDICRLESPHTETTHLMLKALATLTPPRSGIYRFKDRAYDVHDYRATLACKRRIGYVASDAALISNLTIRQNLLLTRYYFENDLSIDLSDAERSLCRQFGLDEKLNLRPAALRGIEKAETVFIREVLKAPEVMLLHMPEDLIQHRHFHLLENQFRTWRDDGQSVVFASNNPNLVEHYANRHHRLDTPIPSESVDCFEIRDATRGLVPLGKS